METAFAKWLREHGESHSAFAVRLGVGKKLTARLAGVGRAGQRVRWMYQPLVMIFMVTGIPVETLTRDADEAAKNPIAPRRYTRKEERDGKEA